MFDKSKREGLIKDYGESLLTNYARYHDATEKLKRFKQTTAAEFASSALAQLEKIDTSGYPMLFREYVHVRLNRSTSVCSFGRQANRSSNQKVPQVVS